MNCIHVYITVFFPGETFLAESTGKGFIQSMYSPVSSEVTSYVKHSRTLRTWEALVLSMNGIHMFISCFLHCKGFFTELTWISLILCMVLFYVLPQVCHAVPNCGTLGTWESLFFSMNHVLMLVPCVFTSKWLAAVAAGIWFFFSVCSLVSFECTKMSKPPVTIGTGIFLLLCMGCHVCF